MNANHINVMPEVPAFDEWDHRAQSAPVVIQTVSGEWYTARWTVYQDSDFAPCWELIGRDGLQIDRDEVVLWFYPSASFAPADQQG